MPSMAFVERHRGQVPLNFDEGEFNVRRFATRALACGERVRYLINDFGKIVRYLTLSPQANALVANFLTLNPPSSKLSGTCPLCLSTKATVIDEVA